MHTFGDHDGISGVNAPAKVDDPVHECPRRPRRKLRRVLANKGLRAEAIELRAEEVVLVREALLFAEERAPCAACDALAAARVRGLKREAVGRERSEPAARARAPSVRNG